MPHHMQPRPPLSQLRPNSLTKAERGTKDFFCNLSIVQVFGLQRVSMKVFLAGIGLIQMCLIEGTGESWCGMGHHWALGRWS